ncbi:MAG TPA: hypothetical protein VKG92_09200 [Flavobacteriales bacterium]|nr:hypothetical protein [Flavobacteriales bacterium]
MKTKFLALCLAVAFATAANAQDALAMNEPAGSGNGDCKCLMKSDASTWKTLGLAADKSTQAQAIVDRCKKEHAAMTEEQRKAQDMAADTHVQELQKLLTVDEFAKWKDWCGKQEAAPATKPAAPATKPKTY